MQSHANSSQIIALYDGSCVICRGARDGFASLDWRRRIRFIDIHDESAWQGLFPTLTRERLMGEIHVIDADGAVSGGFMATRRLLREAPLGLPLWLLLHLPGMDWLGERIYRFIAARRYRINRLLGNPAVCADESCKLPG